MYTIDLNQSLTGYGRLHERQLKADFSCLDESAQGVIDAPDWLPTGSHQERLLDRLPESTYDMRIVYGELLRDGVWPW